MTVTSPLYGCDSTCRRFLIQCGLNPSFSSCSSRYNIFTRAHKNETKNARLLAWCADGQAGRLTDRLTDRQTDLHSSRSLSLTHALTHTDTHRHTHTHPPLSPLFLSPSLPSLSLCSAHWQRPYLGANKLQHTTVPERAVVLKRNNVRVDLAHDKVVDVKVLGKLLHWQVSLHRPYSVLQCQA